MNLGTSLMSLLTGLALGYLVMLGGMYVFQRGLLYHPDRSSPLSPGLLGLKGMEEVWLKTSDGIRLNAWYAKPAEGRKGMVLYLHGNAGNLGGLAGKLAPYLEAGYGVLALDWRGYGNSEGSPTEDGLYADGRAALAYLAGLGVPSDRVVLHGESLGSGVATLLAVENKVAGVILE
ncbi:MAG: alpha/beta fold hydrolase, partial [Rhodospirillales bacterium]